MVLAWRRGPEAELVVQRRKPSSYIFIMEELGETLSRQTQQSGLLVRLCVWSAEPDAPSVLFPAQRHETVSRRL